MTITSVAVATKKFLFGMCDCTVDSDVGTNDFSLVLRIFNVCGHAHVRSCISLGMELCWLRGINTMVNITAICIFKKQPLKYNQSKAAL